MKYFLILMLMISTHVSIAQKEIHRNILLDFSWKFHRGGAIGAEMPTYDDSGWRILDLPHDWSIEDLPGKNSPFDSNAVGQQSTGFMVGGTGWYRKQIHIPAEMKGKSVWLYFEGIYCNSVIWVNGERVGNHPHGYTGFWLDVTGKVQFGKDNLIAVKVSNEGENTRWYSGSGIYRHVWLNYLDPIHFSVWGDFTRTLKADKQKAELISELWIENETPDSVKVELISRFTDPSGKEAALKKSFYTLAAGKNYIQHDIIISSPVLWSTDYPALYNVEHQLISKGVATDRITQTLGIRIIEMDARQGFRLNGISMKLKGGCVHHDHGPLGAKSYDRAEERKVELLKASGFNAVRSAHNPPSEAFLDACDRLGLLVIDEAFDMWEDPKNPMDYHLYFKKEWKMDLESMILRDRNHPSVFLWSIGNEIPGMATPEVVEVAKQLAGYVRKLDPSRPVTAGVHQMNPDKDPFIKELDVAGYNYAFEKYLTDHSRDSGRIIIATESNAWLAFDYWMGVLDYSWVIGDFVWTAFDYLGEASIGWRGFPGDEHLFPWVHAYCGDIDICGWKRPQSYYRDVLWKENQVSVFVKSPVPSFPLNPKKESWSQWDWHDVLQDWNWEPGQPMEVVVYSSCEKVELFLNEKSLGIQSTGRDNRFMASWKVPFQPGVLTAKGLKGKKVVNVQELRTSGEAQNLKLTADRATMSADGQDLCYITVEITDKDGIRDPKAEPVIQFEVEGEGILEAVGNSNPISLESFHGNSRKAWKGRCLVIVKSTGKSGTILLKASSEGLIPSLLKIQSEKLP